MQGTAVVWVASKLKTEDVKLFFATFNSSDMG